MISTNSLEVTNYHSRGSFRGASICNRTPRILHAPEQSGSGHVQSSFQPTTKHRHRQRVRPAIPRCHSHLLSDSVLAGVLDSLTLPTQAVELSVLVAAPDNPFH